MNVLGLRAPSGTGEDIYLTGPLTAKISNTVSAEISNEVSAFIYTTTSAEAEHLELEE